MKEYYKIGEISKLYSIGTDSLRYYEEIGILKPKRDDNGYRMYSINDIRTLNILRELRSSGFSMAEIKEHLADFNLKKTLAMFQKEIDAIDQKLKELQSLKAQLSGRIEEVESHVQAIHDFNQPQIQHLQQRKVLKLSENVYRDADLDFIIKKLQKENEDQLYIIGNGDIGATIPLDYVKNGGYGNFNSVFCIVDDKEDFDAVIPAGSYLCSTIKGSYTHMPSAWNALFTELSTRGLTADSDPMELYIIDNHDTSDESEYITQLQIKIRTGVSNEENSDHR